MVAGEKGSAGLKNVICKGANECRQQAVGVCPIVFGEKKLYISKIVSI